MKLEHLVGDRFKERPADCQVDSHALMVRGGYIKYVANGIYSSYPPLKRVLKKLEQIMREEMDALWWCCWWGVLGWGVVGQSPAGMRVSAKSCCALRTATVPIWCWV